MTELDGVERDGVSSRLVSSRLVYQYVIQFEPLLAVLVHMNLYTLYHLDVS